VIGRRARAAAGVVALALVMLPVAAYAAPGHPPVQAAAGGFASRPLVLVLVMAALSLLPFALLMMTSFVRISVVLSILRSAIGAPSVPPTPVLTGLAMVLTVAVMAPTAGRMYDAAGPALGAAADADLTSAAAVGTLASAAARAGEPLRDFLLKHADPRDRASFHALTLKLRTPAERAAVSDQDFGVLVPAFVTSELRRAFQIGFLIFIPFLVIDLVIANLLLALGMHMLSPTTVSLPFKLLLFVLADGWQLVVRGLLEGFA
jgi:type III secretion protein R